MGRRARAWLLGASLLAAAGAASSSEPDAASESRPPAEVREVRGTFCRHPYDGVEYRARDGSTRAVDRIYRAGPNPCAFLTQPAYPYHPPFFVGIDARPPLPAD